MLDRSGLVPVLHAVLAYIDQSTDALLVRLDEMRVSGAIRSRTLVRLDNEPREVGGVSEEYGTEHALCFWGPRERTC